MGKNKRLIWARDNRADIQQEIIDIESECQKMSQAFGVATINENWNEALELSNKIKDINRNYYIKLDELEAALALESEIEMEGC